MRKLSPPAQSRVLSYLRERVEAASNARQYGKALHGEKRDLSRYRVGEYRLICDIEDRRRTVVVLAVGRRKDVYR